MPQSQLLQVSQQALTDWQWGCEHQSEGDDSGCGRSDKEWGRGELSCGFSEMQQQQELCKAEGFLFRDRRRKEGQMATELLVCLRQVLPLKFWLAWSSLCRPRSSQTHRDLPTSPQVLGVKVYTTMPSGIWIIIIIFLICRPSEVF